MESERQVERHEIFVAGYGYLLAECERKDNGYDVFLYAPEGFDYDTGRLDYADELVEELRVCDCELENCGDIDIAEFLESKLPLFL